MTQAVAGNALTYLRFVSAAWRDEGRSDAELLRAFAADRDERAFSALVGRHAGTVWGVCRRTLGDTPDADDAFQSTFVALARTDAKLPSGEAVGGWLYRVAQRVAGRQRKAARRRQEVERAASPAGDGRPAGDAELLALLDEEVARLPERYRTPLVLCVLEGRTYRDAAAALGCSRTAVLRRLQAGQDVLRRRFERRGVALGVGGVAGLLAAAGAGTAGPPARLMALTVARAVSAEGSVPFGGVPAALWGPAGQVGRVRAALAALAVAAAGAAGGWAGGRFAAAGPRPPSPQSPSPPPSHAQGPAVAPGPEAGVTSGGGHYPAHLRQNGDEASAFARDGRTVFTAAGDAVVRWDPVTGREVERFAGPTGARGVAMSADGRRLAAVGKDEVRVWDLRANPPVLVLATKPDPAEVWALALSADGALLAYGSAARKRIDVMAVADGRAVCTLDSPAARMAFSPDGRTLATAAVGLSPRDVVLWDVPAGTRRATLRSTDEPSYHAGHGRVSGFAFSPDGKTVAVLDVRFNVPSRVEDRRLFTADDLGGRLRLWDAATGDPVWAVETAFSPFNGTVRFAGSGGPVVEAGAGLARFRDPATGREVRPPVECPDYNNPLLVSPDGGRLLAPWSGGLWDLATGKPLRPEAPAGPVLAAAFTPGGDAVATVSGGMYSTAAQVWDAATGRLRRHLKTDWQSPMVTPTVACPTAGLVTASRVERLNDGVYEAGLLAWDPATGDRRPVPGLPAGGHCHAVSPAGNLVAVATGKAVSVVEYATGREVRTWPLSAPLQSLVFSADGRSVAGVARRHNASPADWRTSVEVWAVADGGGRGRVELPHYLRPPSPLPQGCVALSADGAALATPDFVPAGEGQAGGVTVWDVASGKPLRTLGVVTGGVQAVAFSRDGRLLAAGGADGVVRVWERLTGRAWAEFRAGSPVSAVAFSGATRRLAAGTTDGTLTVWDPEAFGPPAVGWDEAWGGLGAADPAAARAAVRTLLSHPERAVRTIRERLRPPASDPAQVARWVADLDAASYQARTRAYDALAARATWLADDLRRSAAAAQTPEAARRLEDLLRVASDPGATPAVRTGLRAVLVLERLATPDAVGLLRDLTRGAWADTPVARDAGAVLRRLPAPPGR